MLPEYNRVHPPLSAQRRQPSPDNEDQEGNPQQQQSALSTSPLEEVIKIAKERKVEFMRQRLDNEGFKVYVEIFLKSTVRKRDWRLNHLRKNVRQFVTIADESLALIILENNIEEWIYEAEEKKRAATERSTTTMRNENEGGSGEEEYGSTAGNGDTVGMQRSSNNKKRKKTRSLYTHGGINPDGTKKGWTVEGIRRYNQIMRKTKVYRLDSRYTGMEDELREMWKRQCKKDMPDQHRGTPAQDGDEDIEEPLTEFDIE